VSIACWSKGEPPFHPARLWLEDGERLIEVDVINSALSETTDANSAQPLIVNTMPKRVFQGQTPGHMGFVLEKEEAVDLLQKDPNSAVVVFPYLTGDDLVGQYRALPSRYIIDFEGRNILDSRAFKRAFRRIETRVLPERKTKARREIERNANILQINPHGTVNHHHEHALNQWWLHFYGRVDRKAALRAGNLQRYIACSRVSKRAIFAFVSSGICPADSLQTFLFDDDYSFGILQSILHWKWWGVKGATLTERPAYTSHSVFATFPFPQHPSAEAVIAVADAGRALYTFRQGRMDGNATETLREMYRLMETPGKNPLKDLHNALDRAVYMAYGFDPQRDAIGQLLALNLQVAAAIAEGNPVTAPGIPDSFPEQQTLVNSACIPALPPV